MKNRSLFLAAILLCIAGFAHAQAPSTFPYVKPVQNDTTTGTTQFTLTKINSSGNAVIMGTSDTNGFAGVCVSNCGTTGTAWIAFGGIVPLKVDGSTTVNHYIKISNSVGGDGQDSGASTFPSGPIDVVGRVAMASTGAGSFSMVDLGPEIQGSLGATINTCSVTNALAIYTASTTMGCGNGDFTYSSHTLVGGASGIVDLSAETSSTGFKIPQIASPAPTTTPGALAWDTTQEAYTVGNTHLGTARLDQTFWVENCTTDANCSTQAATTPGTSNGNQDTASGANGTSTLYFKGISIPANTLIANKLIRACGVFQFNTTATVPNSTFSLNLGTTPIVQIPATQQNVVTNKSWSSCVTIVGTAVAGASVSVTGGFDGYTNLPNATVNQIAQPVSGIATNGALILSWSELWSANTAGNTVTLVSQYVQVLN